jgi:hypothetical protein
MKCVFVVLIVLTTCVQPVFAADFLQGHYYRTDGKRVDGLIRHVTGNFSVFGSKSGHIRFKTDDKAKAVKLGVDDITSFVIGKDSFTLIYNFKINSISGNFEKDFVQVAVIGKMNVYIHKCSSSDGNVFYDHERTVLSKDNKAYLGIWNAKKQQDEIANWFSDRPDLKEKVVQGNFDLPRLVAEYNKVGG